MATVTIEDLARSWIRYQEAWEKSGGPCRACTELQWAYNLAEDLVVDQPELSWELILSVRRFNRSEMIEQMLAAAIFEDLMSMHGSKLIDRVVAEAKRDPTFLGVIRGSYRANMSDEIWSRLKALVEPAVISQVA